MNMNVNQIELNDLFDYDYKIYQNSNFFKFSIDSVLLAEFVDLKSNQKRILDLCSGNAPIPMILNKKYGNNINITGVELQEEVYNLGKKSIEYNKIDNIEFINDNVLNVPTLLSSKKFDIVTCNPPYFKTNDTNLINDNEVKAIARHELKIDLDNLICVASKMLENQGYLYLVHRPERLADITNSLKQYNFGLKRVVPVYGNRSGKANMILIEAIYNGKDYVIVDSPIFLNELSTYKNIFRR